MNLTKENFFNEMKEKYPEVMGIFCKWIDDYKKEVGWDNLFKANESTMQLHSSTYKFHEIPFEMQNGIIARFELEYFNNANSNGKEEYKKLASGYRGEIENIFADLQKQIVKRQKKLN